MALPTHHILVGAQSNDHSAHLAGVSPRRFFTDAGVFARVQVLVSEYYDLDMPINFWDVYNVEAEALGQEIDYPPNGLPDVNRRKQLIASPADLDRIDPPDPYTSGRLPWVREVNRNFLELTGRLERVYFTAPFSLAANIRGYENLVVDMHTRPEFVHRLLTFLCDEVLVPHIEVMRKELNMPHLFMDGRDAWASPPLISPDMMETYVVAYTERLRINLGENVITRGNWGDAHSRDIDRFLAQKIRCSPGSLSVLDPDLFDVGPERVKAFADRCDVSVVAGVDANLLKNGPIKAIVERIKLYIDKLGRDGRFMIHLNQIPTDTPPEHIHAAVAACHAYGRLPIPENLDKVPFEIPQRESFAEFMRSRGESPFF
ncbi:MAG: uroporphyrinogen decarboxylase family protein [Thermodesulfobacteriota bacterium]